MPTPCTLQQLSINDLKKELLRRSTILGIPDLFDILGFNGEVEENSTEDPDYSGDKVFFSLIRQSLETFEYYYPLITFLRSNITFNNGYYEFTNNIQAVYDGILDQEWLELVPRSIVGLTRSVPALTFGNIATVLPGMLIRTYIRYVAPRLYQQSLFNATYFIKGVYNRPFIEEYDSSGRLTDNSRIFYMELGFGVIWDKFCKQCLLTLLEYLNSLKTNLTLPNLPVEVFSSLNEVISKYTTELDKYYNEAGTSGELVI